ncbi:MAG: hypothetical protein R2709_06435 [Marmoricola sp.]
MPKPPRPNNGQADPEFGWVYGGAPEKTRIISREDLKEYQRTGRKPKSGKEAKPAKGPSPKELKRQSQPRTQAASNQAVASDRRGLGLVAGVPARRTNHGVGSDQSSRCCHQRWGQWTNQAPTFFWLAATVVAA